MLRLCTGTWGWVWRCCGGGCEGADRKGEVTDLGDGIEDTVAKMDEGNPQTINNELNLHINEMIEKNEGVWRCKVCGKTASLKRGIRRHAEAHILGISHACHICSKTFTNRPNLNWHIYRIHSELFSCEICGKIGMNREAFRSHKRTKHNWNNRKIRCLAYKR